jgi:ribosomal protein L12E/L44/L45/RPP1/RPP2
MNTVPDVQAESFFSCDVTVDNEWMDLSLAEMYASDADFLDLLTDANVRLAAEKAAADAKAETDAAAAAAEKSDKAAAAATGC